MSQLLTACLDDLSRRIDEQHEEQRHAQWINFLEDGCTDDTWTPQPRTPSPPGVNWPKITVNQALDDGEAMLLQQFGLCSDVLTQGGGSVLNVRCNYGTVIIPTLFDCELFLMDDELDTLPANHPLESPQAIQAAVDSGVPDITRNSGGRVWAAVERFNDVLDQYPVLKRRIPIYHPDVQGPIDNAETIWGSSIFYAFYDQTDLMRDFLNLMTDTYAAFMHRWYEYVPQQSQYSPHWGMLHKGVLMLRNDSLMNLSPQTYIDFVRPCDQRLFDEFGGGGIHFCGRGDHYIEAMSEMTGLTAICMSQPELNDMETIYRNTVDKKIKLLSLSQFAIQSATRPFRGQVHCGTV